MDARATASLALLFLLLATPVRSQQVIATVTVADDPTGVTVDPVSGRVFVASYDTGEITVIDPATNEPEEATLPVGAVLTGVAVNAAARRLYAADAGAGQVIVINLETGKIAARVATGREPYGLHPDPATGALYVTNHGDSALAIVD